LLTHIATTESVSWCERMKAGVREGNNHVTFK
jgi:hypothetical protein